MNKIKTKTSTVYIENDILRVDYMADVRISISDAIENVEAEKELISSLIKMPLLVDIRNVKSIESEARDYFTGVESQQIISKAALWTDSPISNMIGNFFIGLNKGTVPVKLFSNKDKAITWLISND
ncbi:MAG: hypothetical protein OEW67_01480 [Cyclobacteriaceae bacterium]|nr:hypothetical protein [Cyclobacteriaceae bacterium]